MSPGFGDVSVELVDFILLKLSISVLVDLADEVVEFFFGDLLVASFHHVVEKVSGLFLVQTPTSIFIVLAVYFIKGLVDLIILVLLPLLPLVLPIFACTTPHQI